MCYFKSCKKCLFCDICYQLCVVDINNYICDPFILIMEISVLNNSKLGRVAQIAHLF